MNFFYYIGRIINYTFAVSLFTFPMGIICVIFGYYLGISFIIASYEQIIHDLLKWVLLALAIPTVIYCVQFGLLAPIKIPAVFKSFRRINKNISGGKLNTDIDDEELRELYNNVVFIPMFNMVSTVFYGVLSAILLIVLIYIDHVYALTYSYKYLKMVIRIVAIGGMISVVLYALIAYLITDIITARERATCYNELRRRNIIIEPISLLGLRVKFSFFAVLMIITLLTFGALIEKGRFYGEANIASIVIYFIFSIAAGFLLMYVNANSILRIISSLTKAAEEIATGGELHFEVLPLERELSAIEYAMMEMKSEIDEHRINLEMKVEERTIELQNVLSDLKERDDLIQKQLDMASTIQRSILPGNIEDWSELKFSVRYIAMEKIGGDFYDIIKLPGDKLSILIADVSGHGIPAALVTSMAKISFRNAGRRYDSPKRIFQEVNQDILDHIKTQDYLTCFFLVMDDEYNVTYANASHQKGVILRTDDEKIELLDTGGLFIGAIEDARETYEEKKTRLNYGDRIILYTDGISEATNEGREEYSTERLLELILDNSKLPLEDFTNSIIADVRGFIGNSPVEDDITLVVIELVRDHTIDIIKSVKKLIPEDKYDEAIETLERGLALYPDDKKLLYNLAKIYFRIKNFNKVIECINKYVENDNENKYAYYIGGAAFYQMNNYKMAIDFLKRAIGLDPNFVNALFALGMAYKKQGLKDHAIKYFEKVANIDVDNKKAIYELEALKK